MRQAFGHLQCAFQERLAGIPSTGPFATVDEDTVYGITLAYNLKLRA